MSLKGKVKWFNGKKGYGFIEREDKEKDVFVHASAVREAGLRFLNEGDELTFEVEDGDKGPSAVKLQKPLNSNSNKLYRSILGFKLSYSYTILPCIYIFKC